MKSSAKPSEEDYDFLAEDFEAYAEVALVIRPKEGDQIPLVLNRAQRFVHEMAESQIAERGKVRIIVPKGRQQGISTYITGRGYQKTTNRKGYRTFILTHEDEATQNIFGMVKRYHEHCPEDLKPATGAANANELYFSKLDSGYKIATAGGRNPGRSQTVQFLHASEVAFWPNAETHARGVMQTVADVYDTEVWVESTSDGPGNYFHKLTMDALAGKNDFAVAFIPWWWDDGYCAPLPSGFTPTKEEAEMLALFGEDGLTHEHLAWRRKKISELGGEGAFAREYPNTIEQAFEAVAHDRLIAPNDVKACQKRDIEPTNVRPIWGVDCARFGDDQNTLAKRQGNVQLEKVKSWGKADTMTTVGRIVTEYRKTPKEDRPSDIIVDSIGIGAGVADRLREVFKEEGWDEGPFATRIVDVNVGEAAAESDHYNRLRDELWGRSKEWVEDPSSRLCEDDTMLELDLCTPTFSYTSGGKLAVESKADMKKRAKRSPDHADAWNNTFYKKPKSRRQKQAATEESGSAGGFWAS